MNNGWFFGCSFTYGAGCTPGDRYHDKYKHPNDRLWTEIVSEALNVKENNLGVNSASNLHILDRFNKNIKNFKSGDYVVVGLTDPTRVGFFHYTKPNTVNQMSVNAFDQIYPDGRFSTFMSEVEFTSVQNFGKYIQGPNEDKWSYHYRKVIKSYFYLLNKLGIRTYLWDFNMWLKHDPITRATKEEIQDRHWSFEGHRTFATHVIGNFNGERPTI